MSDSTDPPWHFLPYAPRQFFGLASDADKEQLKQAYSTLIRRFKPDKYPEEFKKIRAAFEQVERELRYGISEPFSPIEFTTQPITKSEQQTDIPEGLHVATPLTERAIAYQRIGSVEPNAWYAELSLKEPKSPHDYYLLAVLSDVVDHAEQGFFAWIAEGYARHPLSRELTSLLQSILASPELATQEMADLLCRLSRHGNSRDYFFMTEALWQRYSLKAPWDEVELKLRECEENLVPSKDGSRMAFTVALMRKVLWRASITWLHEKKRWIEESPGALQNAFEFDHELNCKLIELREHHTARLEQGKYGLWILRTIQSFCEEGEWDAVTKICDCQTAIATNAKEFLSEFDYREGENWTWSVAWAWISWIALSKLPTQEGPGERQEMIQLCNAAIRRINSRFPRRIGRRIALMNFAAMLCITAAGIFTNFFVAIVVIAIGLSIFGPQEQMYVIYTTVILILVVMGTIYGYSKVYRRFNTKVIQPYTRKSVMTEYRSKWRLIVARLMQCVPCPFHYFLDLVKHVSSSGKQVHLVSSWLPILMQEDLGLLLYCTAVPFSR